MDDTSKEPHLYCLKVTTKDGTYETTVTCYSVQMDALIQKYRALGGYSINVELIY